RCLQRERSPDGAERIHRWRPIAALGDDRTGDPADGELALHDRAAVVAKLDAGRAEAQLRMRVAVEEVVTAHHVLAELRRVADRQGLAARARLERRPVALGDGVDA